MKQLFSFAVLFGTLVASAASSTPAGFTDNLDAALERAAKSGKYVYVCFSGSDWCGWCMKLEKEVFSQKEFIDAVTNEFELVYIDMPRNQEVLSARAKTENPKLLKQYGIEGFPSALLLDGKGERIGKTGYRKGGPAAYAEHLKDLLKNKDRQLLANQWIEPYANRQRKIMEKLDRICGDYLKEEMAKGVSEKDARKASRKFLPAAADELEALLKEVEALKVPPAIEEMHQQQIEAQKGLVQIFKEAVAEDAKKQASQQ